MNAGTTLKLAPIGTAGRPSSHPGDGGPLPEIAAASGSGADLILLPQLSFSPYFPVARDRDLLELGERLPSNSMRAAMEAAGESHLAASVYECVGEGVFYVRGELSSLADGCLLADRQHRVEAEPGRYEQMFFSPGFGARQVAELPWGPTGLLLGADVREAGAWSELAAAGAALVLASVSEPAERWQGTKRIAAGLAAANGIAVAVVNRAPSESEPDFAGGALVADAGGAELGPDQNGIYEVSIPVFDSSEGNSDE